MGSTGSLRQAVASYAARLHGDRDDHHVASPLGAWLLLALAAGSAGPGDPRRPGLEAALAMTVDDAADQARRLLGAVHPDVHTAVGAWLADAARSPAAEGWLAALPPVTATGPVPAQARLDEWTRQQSLGLVPAFPLEVSRATAVLLATVLASDIDWEWPFDELAPDRLGGPWGEAGATCLGSAAPHDVGIVRTTEGLVGVHVARSVDGLAVLSVIAEDPDSAPAAVREVAHDLALLDVAEWDRVSLFDLPLGDSGAWTVTERVVAATSPGDQEEARAVLPAWRADTTIDLMAEELLGIAAAADGVAGLLPPQLRPFEAEAVQVCTAAYTRTGFEAAAVSALGIRAAAYSPGRRQRVRRREATVRFGRPYAVVALTEGHGDDDPWTRLPVFSGWVTSPAYS
ncbi:hypothetical protein [Nocardioides sp.]|uniref:hypothetical protein n=1 Tax=Nocardioides sp. TaxID=35761 RepID=UPI0027330C67|nr:hypothetical protein [Nocardioides sp.]MDP3893851.1 hypothetical protein [Nocardioides sp.]